MLTGQAQDSEQIWPGLTQEGIDHEDILIAMAPKPVLVLAVQSDFFPIEGTRQTVARTRRFWEICGKGNLLEYYEDDSPYAYTVAMAKEAAGFFSRHLLNSEYCADDVKIQTLDGAGLWCAKSGQVMGEMPGARIVHDENADKLKQLNESRKHETDAHKKEKALRWLKEKVFESRKPCEQNPRIFGKHQINELTAQTVLWWTQERLMNYGVLFRHCRLQDDAIPLTIGVWEGGTRRLQQHMRWIKVTCSGGRAVLVLDVSSDGNISPAGREDTQALDFYGIVPKLAQDLIWLNDSLPALRTYDVIRAVDAACTFKGIDNGDISFYASGRYGIYAQFAYLLDKRVKAIETVDGIQAYSDWVSKKYYEHYDIMSVNMPGILRYFDLPEMKKWIAEKKKSAGGENN